MLPVADNSSYDSNKESETPIVIILFETTIPNFPYLFDMPASFNYRIFHIYWCIEKVVVDDKDRQ